MKKILIFMIAFMFFIIPVKAYADSATVEIVVNGEVKRGSTIEILVNVKNANKLYAASNQLKIESIVASDFITEYDDDIIELGGETNKNGNTASYSFTFLGEKDGIKGSGTIAVISAEVLNDDKLSIGQDNMKVKLVQKVGDTVENYSFQFSGYNDVNNSEVSDGNNTVTNNNGNSQEELGNNSSSSNESNGSKTDSSKEKIEVAEDNGENSNNDKNNEKENKENDHELESSLDNTDETKDNNFDEDNSEEKALLTSENSNGGILIASTSIFILVIVGGVYYINRNRK